MSKGVIGFIFSLIFCPFGLPSLILCKNYKEDRHPNLSLAGFIIGCTWLATSIFVLAIVLWALPPPQTTPPPASPPGQTAAPSLEVDWDKVEITNVYEGSDEYSVSFHYDKIHGWLGSSTVYIDKDEYSPETVRDAIEEHVTRRLTEKWEEEERLRKLQESLKP